jgi:hypothetical protein
VGPFAAGFIERDFLDAEIFGPLLDDAGDAAEVTGYKRQFEVINHSLHTLSLSDGYRLV